MPRATNVLITGSAGWTAQAIIEALNAHGHAVSGFDLPSASYLPEIRQKLAAVFVGDNADAEAVRECVQVAQPDVVIHLAVAVRARDYDDPERPFATNVRGTYNLFESARRSGVSRIVLMSSAAVHLPGLGDT